MEKLAGWRQDLSKRFPAIANFQADLRAVFYVDVGFGVESYRQFEPTKHRAFFDRTVQKLLSQISEATALAITETFPGSVVARFEGEVWCKPTVKPSATLTAHLGKMFPGAAFGLKLTEIKP